MDLVERLRVHLRDYAAAVEAADEIQRLRAELRLARDIIKDLHNPSGVRLRRLDGTLVPIEIVDREMGCKTP